MTPRRGKQATPEELAEESRFEEIAARIRSGEALRDGFSGLDDRMFFEHAHESADSFLARATLPGLTNTAQGKFQLPLPPDYRPQDSLRFLSRDEHSVTERVHQDGFEKVFPEPAGPAWLRVRFDTGIAHCETDAAQCSLAFEVARRILGLHSNTAEFERLYTQDSLLGRLIGVQHGLRIPLSATPWEGLVWAIAGQQITLRAAITMRRELLLAHGELHPSGLRTHPTAAAVARMESSDLLALKFSRAKADYITGAARAVVTGDLPLDGLAGFSARKSARLLGSIRGIGPWTVQYVMLRALGFQDCLPASDAGLAQALERLPEVGRRLSEIEIRKLLDRFTPYRSLATCHLWASL